MDASEPNGAAAIGLTCGVVGWLALFVVPPFAIPLGIAAFLFGRYGSYAPTGKGVSLAAQCVGGALLGLVALVLLA